MRIGIANRCVRRMSVRRLGFRQSGLALLVLLALDAGAAPAHGELLRVGKAVPEAFSFVPLDVGVRYGFFKRKPLLPKRQRPHPSCVAAQSLGSSHARLYAGHPRLSRNQARGGWVVDTPGRSARGRP